VACLQIPDDDFHARLQVKIDELTTTIRILLHDIARIGLISVVDWAPSRQVLFCCLSSIAGQVALELFPEPALLLWRHLRELLHG
jgi:hypothetical protein